MSGNEEPTAQERPTRCSLVSPSDAVPGNFKPSLAIDVDKDTISVVDLKTNALVASAPLAQVTTTPANRHHYRAGWLPILVVCVPGVRPLTLGCLDQNGYTGYRFSWRGTVPQEKDPAYYVSGADFSTLVDKLGLAPQLYDSRPPGGYGPPPWYQQPRGQTVLRRMVIGVLVFGVLACVVIPICIAIVSHILH